MLVPSVVYVTGIRLSLLPVGFGAVATLADGTRTT